MPRPLTIASIIAALVVWRLLLPPVPGLFKFGRERWGHRITITLFTISLTAAALLIYVSRR